MATSYIAITELKKNPSNPRVVKSEPYQKLLDSLQSERGKEFFEARPCIVSDRTGEKVILAGNTRFQAACDLGWKEVPAVILDNLTEEQEQEIIIRDNVSNGEWNWDMLANEWDAEKLTDWGLELPDTMKLEEEEVQEDDYVMPDTINTDIVVGDLITIGEHRLLCGDSTDVLQLETLVGTQIIDMIFADPPYGISHSGKGIQGKTTGNDFGEILGDGDVLTAITSFNLLTSLHPNALHVFFGANYYPSCIPDGHGWLVWDKEREGDTFSGAELAFVNKGVKVDVFRHQWHGMIKGSERGEKRIHPTQKPIALVEHIINTHKIQGCILDPFLGSGVTMVTAHKMNLRCYGMELDPKYCQVIIARMKKLDPSLPITINGKSYQ